MKKGMITILLFFISSVLLAQSIPVTFHFKPPDNITFTKLRVVGSFNGWNNADPALEMTGPNSYGEYEITTPLATATDHNYKFCMDANWGFAYGDPDNPRINTADNNNSIMTPKDPMITYLLPRDINTSLVKFIDNTPAGMPIRAIFNFSADKPIDPTTITLKIDGKVIANPAQYYNATTREIKYVPSPALSTGDHTVIVTITSAAGTDTKTSTFRRDPNYVTYKVPVDFYYDQNNKTITFLQTLTDVAALGAFNNWNDAINPLLDSDRDGLWEGTADLEPGTSEYKFKLNKTAWVNDPDCPLISETADANNLIIAKADTMSSMKLILPPENKTFPNDTTVAFKILLRPGVLSKGVDKTSIKIKVDDKDITSTYDVLTSTVSTSVVLTGNGRHTVSVAYKNQEGISTSKLFSYGINTAKKGVYLVDGLSDEEYKYPAGIQSGSTDILSVSITETTKHDSLNFSVQLKSIDPRTRIGLLITNPVSNMIDAPKQLNIKLPDWSGQGVFATIGVPVLGAINQAVENRFMISSNPAVYEKRTLDITSTTAQALAGFINFKVSLKYLDSLMGSWKLPRQFGIFSFIAATDNSGNAIKPAVSEGGNSSSESPNVYDAAFMRTNFWQKRMLESFIPAGQKGAPRMVSFDGQGRGFQLISGTDISDSLPQFGTDITFLTPGAEYWYKNVTVHGVLSDTTIKTITFVFNNVPANHTISGGKFDIPVVLLEGTNVAYVTATDSKGFKSASKDLVLTYKPDVQPTITLEGTANKRQVTMNAVAASPTGSALEYMWAPDAGNPASIELNSTSSSVTFTIPNVDGEYIIAAAVTDAQGNIAIARKIVVAAGDSVYIPDNNYHARWIDDAIFYEIYPRSFSAQGGFKGITDKIDQIKELGVNAIWLMPVFEGPTVHGYEITNYYTLEKDYGTEEEFRTMLYKLKDNGIKVILDFVVNHTSISHPFMQNVFQYRDYSPWANFYLWSGQPGNSSFAYYYDWSSLPNLNHNNPDVRKYFVDVAKYWIQNFDIAGYRCDVAWGVQERNTLFWQEWRKGVKNINPTAFLEAEATSADPVFYQNRFDSANDWELRNKIIGALNGSVSLANLHAEATRTYTTYARPFRFIENHDEQRATAMFDAKRALMIHTLLFNLNGVPLIYSGGEVGELTNRGLIKWEDPNKMKPYFKRLIEVKKSYIHNPKIDIIGNSSSANVYSFSSISGNNTIVTAANFREAGTTVVFDLTKLPFTGTKDYYLTDLFSGSVIKVAPSARNSVSISLNGYQARVFYFGADSIKVITGVDNDVAGNVIPTEMKLFQNYPNPFNPTSIIRYQTTKAGLVSLKVFDVLGREVSTLVNEVLTAGTHECTFNGSGLSSGVYFYQIKAGDFVSTKKFTLMK